jgi:hypothetical protein
VRSWRTAPNVDLLEWDGRDAHGETVLPGVYLLDVATGSVRAQRKLIRLP